MSTDWTIDTNILYQATSNDSDAIYLILKIQHLNEKVILDYEGKIQKQYGDCLKKTRQEAGYDLVKSWLIQMESKFAAYVSSNLEDTHKRQLEKRRFHRKDLPFVGACSRSTNKRIVSHDPVYYIAEIKAYLESEMDIRVMLTKEAIR